MIGTSKADYPPTLGRRLPLFWSIPLFYKVLDLPQSQISPEILHELYSNWLLYLILK